MSVTLKPIGKSADDLRFFILWEGQHAGGITVHSVRPPCFSYGIAISPDMRRRGIAKAALPLLFDVMRQKGFSRVIVQVASANAASLALHASLGFRQTGQTADAVSLSKSLL